MLNVLFQPDHSLHFIYRGDGEAEMKIKAEFLKMDGDRLVLLAL